MLRWCTTNEFFGYPEEGSPETLDDFPFVPRGNLRRERKKRTFSTGTSIWTTNRVLPLFFNFLSPKQFGSTRLRCLVCSVPGGRKICSLDSLDSKCDQDFARQFQISKFVGATDSDSHNSAFLLWMCLFIEHSPSFQ